MLYLDKLSLHDYATHRMTEFPFLEGITVLRGNNRCGKSALFAPLMNILYGEGIMPSGSRATLVGAVDDTEFEITAMNNGKKDRYSLIKNGRAIDTDTIAKTGKEISDIIEVSAALFPTTISVTGTVKHPLALGTSATRSDWVHNTLAFAETYDFYADKVNSLLKDIKPKAQEYEVLYREYRRILDSAPPDPGEYHGSSTQTISNNIAIINEQLDRVQRVLDAPVKPSLTIDEIDANIASITKKCTYLTKLEQAWKNYEAVASDKVDVSAATTYLNSFFEDYKVPTKLHKDLDRLDEVLGRKISELQSKLAEATKSNALYDDQSSLRQELVEYQRKPPEDYSEDIIRLTGKISFLEAELESASDGCSICGKDLSKYNEQRRDKLTALRARAAKLKDEQDKYKKYTKLAAIQFVELVNTTELTGKLKEYKKARKAVTILVKSVPMPDKVFDAEEYDVLLEELNDLRSARIEVQAYNSAEALSPEDLKLAASLSKKELKALRNKLREELAEYTHKLSVASDKRSAYNTALAVFNNFNKEADHLESKLTGLKDAKKKYKVLLALREAFGRNGLRADTLSASIELFVANLNTYAPLIWSEPFKFDLEIGARKCNLIAHRNSQSGTIFTLSGSEQRGFQLISALALLRILPSQSRCDTIILDELESNCDTATKSRIAHEFLPELRKSVDKVIIVTPLSPTEFPVPADNNATVLKKNNVSTIKWM